MLTGKDLLSRGWPQGPLIGLALEAAKELSGRMSDDEIISLLERVRQHPSDFSHARSRTRPAGTSPSGAPSAREQRGPRGALKRARLGRRPHRLQGHHAASQRHAPPRHRGGRADARRARRLRHPYRRRGGLGGSRRTLHGGRGHRLPHDDEHLSSRTRCGFRQRHSAGPLASRPAQRDPLRGGGRVRAGQAPSARGVGRYGVAKHQAATGPARQGLCAARHQRQRQPLRGRRGAHRQGRGR